MTAEQDAMVDDLFERLERAEDLIKKWRAEAKASSMCQRGQGGAYALERCAYQLELAIRPSKQSGEGRT